VQDPGQPAAVGGGQFERGFLGVNHGHWLVRLDEIALGFEPVTDLNFRDGLADGGDF
jgi:hypothetical protein